MRKLSLLMLLVAMVGCDGEDVGRDQAPVLSEDPPYGLAEIDMPKTGDELVAALERLPAIDGRQPTVTREGDLVFVVYEGTTLPHDNWSMWVFLDVAVESEWFIDSLRQGIVDAEEEGRIVEASDLDPSDDLVWVAENRTEGGTTTFGMTWADPSDLGPSYSVTGDTADFRLKLVHAFIGAVGD